MKLFIDGIELKDCIVVQNKLGVIYAKDRYRGPYWGITIEKFDDATPPAGYARMENASHRFCVHSTPAYVYPTYVPYTQLQYAYDFKAPAGSIITSDSDVEVLRRFSDWAEVRLGDHMLYPTHGVALKSGFIKAGDPIFKVTGSHLHLYDRYKGAQYDLKDFALYSEESVPPSNRMVYRVKTAMRSEPGGYNDKDANAATEGPAIGEIVSGPVPAISKRDGRMYDWYQIRFLDGEAWVIDSGLRADNLAAGDLWGKDITHSKGIK